MTNMSPRSLEEAHEALSPRRFHAFGVGMAKSGTHSLAAIFQNYRAMHEPQHEQMLKAILAADQGAFGPEERQQFLRQRDRELALEMDVSQLNHFFLPELLSLFPDAKFVLTIRDCYSWLDSLINHQLGRDASADWQRLRDLRFGRRARPDASAERLLAEHDLYALDGYFSYWARHNHAVLDRVPSDRLLVVRTAEIAQSLPALATFIGVPAEMLLRSQAHLFAAERRFGILQQLDRAYLQAKAEWHCGELMRAFFPTIRSCDDVFQAA
jgi:Sulfotransferase domain